MISPIAIHVAVSLNSFMDFLPFEIDEAQIRQALQIDK